jgi:hypothetical protein
MRDQSEKSIKLRLTKISKRSFLLHDTEGPAEGLNNQFPSMGMIPKFNMFHGLLYETCFEKFDEGLFALRFYTNMYKAVKKAQKGCFKSHPKILLLSDKNNVISYYLSLTTYICGHAL